MDKFLIWVNLCLFLKLDVTGELKIANLEDENSTEAEAIQSSNLTTANNEVNEIQLFPITSYFPGQTRQPRKFFSKLHSGAAFLTGFKLGSILGKKGFELGSGQIASAHNFQLFGKNVNSAMSLSYGNSLSSLPVLDNTQNAEEEKSGLTTKDVFLVTVIENSSLRTPTKLEETITEKNKENTDTNDEYSEEPKTRSASINFYEEVKKEEVDKSFLEKHNDLVKKINEKLLKKNNSKF